MRAPCAAQPMRFTRWRVLPVGPIAHDDRAVGDSRLGGAAGALILIGTRQQAIGHIARELAANATAGAKAKPLVLRLELSAVVDIGKAQGSAI